MSSENYSHKFPSSYEQKRCWGKQISVIKYAKSTHPPNINCATFSRTVRHKIIIISYPDKLEIFKTYKNVTSDIKNEFFTCTSTHMNICRWCGRREEHVFHVNWITISPKQVKLLKKTIIFETVNQYMILESIVV